MNNGPGFMRGPDKRASATTFNGKGSSMIVNKEIRPDMMVHAQGAGSMGGRQGIHVGTVDHLDGEQWIKLKKDDSEDGRHHWIPTSWVETVDEGTVYLNRNAEEFKGGQLDEKPDKIW